MMTGNRRLMKAGAGAVVLLVLLWLSAQGFFLLNTQRADRLQKYERQFFDLFDTVTQISGYAEKEKEFEEKAAFIRQRLEYYAALYDIYQEYDGIVNLKTINQAAGREPLTVKPEIIDLLRFGQEAYRQSGGEVNLAFGSVLRLWHRYRQEAIEKPEQARLPEMTELREAARHTSIDDILLEEKQGTVFLRDEQMSLDVGAVAKGYAVERVAQELEAAGISGFLLNAGGNVRAIGAKPDGSPWRIGIQNPDMQSEIPYIEEVWLTEESLVTSGSYQRFYMVEGKAYHHIIDKDSLMPSEHFLSVSVVTKDSGKADAYSTAAFNMPPEESRRFIEALPEVEAMWVLKSGEILYSSGFMKYTPPTEEK